MKLAINGGRAVRQKPFPAYVTVGEEEKAAAIRVIDSGALSRYLGAWHEQFMGGPEVVALEKQWAEYYGAKHAVAVNSATSGLICAVGAAGIGPGDEVIVGPWSMSISATAPLFYGGIPVFADIEPDFFCLDPDDVARKITPKTKAIIAVDLFGQPISRQLSELATRHGLTLIEDAAQAPGGTLDGRPCGRLGQVGIYSLNYHKHIHSGEGGVIVTDDDRLAQRLCLIRNHAEAVVEGMGTDARDNMLGFNFRMTELDAAVAGCQLKKLAALNEKRLANVAFLEKGLADIACLTPPKVRPGGRHVYYVHAFGYDRGAAGIAAARFVEALRHELPPFTLREKEGTKLGVGYTRPLYQLPLFRQRMAIGANGWPFTLAPDRRYEPGLCPVCEKLYDGGILTHEFMLPSMNEEDLKDVIDAFHKVWELRHELN